MPPLFNNYSYRLYPPFSYRNPGYVNNRYAYNFRDGKHNEIQNDHADNALKKSKYIESPNDSSNRGKLNNKAEPIFEIFGIRLFFDDILIIFLIFFLYNEGIQDTQLFIALILLLLS